MRRPIICLLLAALVFVCVGADCWEECDNTLDACRARCGEGLPSTFCRMECELDYMYCIGLVGY